MKLTNTTEQPLTAFQIDFPAGETVEVRDDLPEDKLAYLARKGVVPEADAAAADDTPTGEFPAVRTKKKRKKKASSY